VPSKALVSNANDIALRVYDLPYLTRVGMGQLTASWAGSSGTVSRATAILKKRFLYINIFTISKEVINHGKP